MGRHNKPAKPSNPWPLIILFLLPVLGLAFLIFVFMRNGGGPDVERGRRDARERSERLSAVSAVLDSSGASIREVRPGVSVVTLPTARALTVTPTAAKELALTTQTRVGGIVRVETPAGQVLAEVP